MLLGDSTVDCMSLPPADRRTKEKKLAANIQAARQRHIQARIELLRLVYNIPECVDGSDGAKLLEEIRGAGQVYQGTRSQYNQAVEAYRKFAVDENKPEDS